MSVAARSVLLASLLLALAALLDAAMAYRLGDRCYLEPTLAPSTSFRIAEIDRMLRNSANTTQTQACELFARGLLHHFDGDPGLAIEDYSRAIDWMPDPVAGYEMRGDAYEDAGQHDKALADYAQAAKSKPDVRGLANLCWVRAVRGRPLDRALADCNGALAQKPDDTDAREARCFVFYRLGKVADAVPDCDAVLKEKPRLAAALYIRGLAKRHAGDEAGGAADIAAALDINPRTARFFALWGVK